MIVVTKHRSITEMQFKLQGGIIGGRQLSQPFFPVAGLTLVFTTPAATCTFVAGASPQGLTFAEIKTQIQAAIANTAVQTIELALGVRPTNGIGVVLGATGTANSFFGFSTSSAQTGKFIHSDETTVPYFIIAYPTNDGAHVVMHEELPMAFEDELDIPLGVATEYFVGLKKFAKKEHHDYRVETGHDRGVSNTASRMKSDDYRRSERTGDLLGRVSGALGGGAAGHRLGGKGEGARIAGTLGGAAIGQMLAGKAGKEVGRSRDKARFAADHGLTKKEGSTSDEFIKNFLKKNPGAAANGGKNTMGKLVTQADQNPNILKGLHKDFGKEVTAGVNYEALAQAADKAKAVVPKLSPPPKFINKLKAAEVEARFLKKLAFFGIGSGASGRTGGMGGPPSAVSQATLPSQAPPTPQAGPQGGFLAPTAGMTGMNGRHGGTASPFGHFSSTTDLLKAHQAQGALQSPVSQGLAAAAKSPVAPAAAASMQTGTLRGAVNSARGAVSNAASSVGNAARGVAGSVGGMFGKARSALGAMRPKFAAAGEQEMEAPPMDPALNSYMAQEQMAQQAEQAQAAEFYKQRFQQASQQLQQMQEQSTGTQQQLEAMQASQAQSQQQVQQMTAQAAQSAQTASQIASQAMSQAMASQQDLLQQQQASTQMRMAWEGVRGQLQQIATQEPPPATTGAPSLVSGLGAQAASTPEMAPDAQGSPTAAPPGGNPAEANNAPSAGQGGGDAATMAPGKIAMPLDMMGAVGGGALGAGIGLASAHHGFDDLRSKVQQMEAGDDNSFRGAMNLAQAKARLAVGEMMEKHPGGAALVGGALGATIGRKALPAMHELRQGLTPSVLRGQHVGFLSEGRDGAVGA